MSLTTVEKKQIIAEFGRTPDDTGSPEVQVALLTYEINKLTEHMKKNGNDLHSRRGLLKKVSNRRSLLDYLKRKFKPKYESLIARLGLRK